MFTAGNVRDTLEMTNDRATILALRLDKLSTKEKCRPFVYSVPFSKIYQDISYILEKFRTIPQGMGRRMQGLTVVQLSYVLDKMGEPWPNIWIAIAIRYQLLAVSNKNYSLEEIMEMRFNNLDVNQTNMCYSRFSFANFDNLGV